MIKQLSVLLFAASLPVLVAQGPPGDNVTVTFDRPVKVGSVTLPPGEYTVRQVTSASNPRVLEFTSNHGTQLDTTVTAIPILQNIPPDETKVILEDEGGGARLSRIWVQGKSYGYEIPGTTAVASQASAGLRLEARYEAQPAPQPVVMAQAQPVETPAAAAPPTPVETPAQAQAPAPEPAPAPAPAPQAAAPEPAATPAPADNRPAMPETALGWAQLLLAGFALTGWGALLYMRSTRAAS